MRNLIIIIDMKIFTSKNPHQLWWQCRDNRKRHLRNSMLYDRNRFSCPSRLPIVTLPQTSSASFEPLISNHLPYKCFMTIVFVFAVVIIITAFSAFLWSVDKASEKKSR
jgi:hypothetical protein